MFNVLFLILIHNLLSNTQLFPFDTIVSFGDDNTDTGNAYSLTNHQWPLVPPYYQGRFTNGPVWIEQLNISRIMNYAYIGATIDNDNLIAGFIPPNRTLVPGVRQQIVTYLANNDITTINLSSTLYVIWAGANDYFDNASLTSDLVVASLMDAVSDLLGVGITNVLIMNQPPLQDYPAFLNSSKGLNLSTKIINHNNYLSTNISQIPTINNEVSLQIFDLYSLISNILSNNSTWKLNKTNKCWTILNDSSVLQCAKPNDYVFIDDYHFTSFIHQTIADSIRQFLLSSSSYLSSSKLSVLIYIIVFIIKGN
jgi:outer membrane lipase/esterase